MVMVNIDKQHSKSTTFRRLLENDSTLEEVRVGAPYISQDDSIGYLSSPTKLAGEAIGNNDCVSKLVICGGIDEETVETFMNGVGRNNNIDGLIFVGWDVLNGSVFPYMTPWLRSNNNLTMLQIVRCNGMGRDGLHLLAAALVGCTSLEHVAIRNCSIEDDDESFQEVINALDNNNHTCNQLDVSENNIGRKGCDALATMLSNPLCGLKTLTLSHNNIDDEGVAYLTQGLSNNDRLETMDIAKGNPMITNQGWASLSKILCNGHEINDTYLSNHRLKHLGQRRQRDDDLELYLSFNRATSDNAIFDPFIPVRKVILCHKDEWDMKPYIDEDLTLLPYILQWVERAGVLNTNFGGIHNRQKRQYRRTLQSLTNLTLHQFVRSFPIVVVDRLQSTI